MKSTWVSTSQKITLATGSSSRESGPGNLSARKGECQLRRARLRVGDHAAKPAQHPGIPEREGSAHGGAHLAPQRILLQPLERSAALAAAPPRHLLRAVPPTF